jgi:3-hydroxybutyryl-CoA dehydratase
MVTAGTTLSHERMFTREDIERFAELTGDRGRHHVVENPIVHGLLTASLATKLGGDLDFLASEMHFEFLRPVYVGDTIRCELVVDEATPDRGRTRVRLAGTCTNQRGEEVLKFSSRGVIR